jgi:hypothetical protein
MKIDLSVQNVEILETIPLNAAVVTRKERQPVTF